MINGKETMIEKALKVVKTRFTNKELEKKFLGKKLIFIDQYSGEDLFVVLITAGEYGMYVAVAKSFDSHIKKGDEYVLKVKSDYITVLDGNEEIAIWSEDWDKKYR